MRLEWNKGGFPNVNPHPTKESLVFFKGKKKNRTVTQTFCYDDDDDGNLDFLLSNLLLQNHLKYFTVPPPHPPPGNSTCKNGKMQDDKYHQLSVE